MGIACILLDLATQISDVEPQELHVAESESHVETLPLNADEPAAEFPDDEDMLIVDDDYDDSAPHSIVAVRRQAYGRLFTKLRRG